ncbi:MAG: hypothetical protein DRO99_02140 [Candidatus Aenigmatarchaeota archaeon]|nr:MAG: hypothetical protein DRO99_02140 [Candidatus Aenigmarchaeota archaeon]
MARIIGDYTGTTWEDFLVLPGMPPEDSDLTPEDVDLSSEICGVKLKLPFMTAAMRSVTGKDLALAAGKLGMMAVAPRGLTVDREVDIVKYVKDNAVEVGDIESEYDPTTVRDDDTLNTALQRARKTGHSNIPVVTRKSDFVGMFHYKPSRHDNMEPGTPITDIMKKYNGNGNMPVCRSGMGDEEIKRYMDENDLRMVPVIDEVGRLDRLVFKQRDDAYKVGAAVDTHPGWEKRAEKLIEAGADIIFIDTSDAHKKFAGDLLEKYKKLFSKGPPICGGNVVTPDGFQYLVDHGADAVKLGMGPGSICSTNDVLGVGAPPFWSLVEVANRRDEYARGGHYVPLIADGGIEGTSDIIVALSKGDFIMGGRLYVCFLESEAERMDRHGKIYPKGMLSEDEIMAMKIFGEGSREARQTTGNMRRYAAPNSKEGISTIQGVSGWVPYQGRFKPGVERQAMAVKEGIYHSGAVDLPTYREKAVLIRTSEKAKGTSSPHGIDLIGD